MKRLPAVAREGLAAVIESILFVAEEPVATSLLVKEIGRASCRERV